MSQDTTTGTNETATVHLAIGDRISSYIARFADGRVAGRADFIDAPEGRAERIFFHTEVDPAYGGRGFGMLLLREALADSIRQGVTVVPVCPLFARHLTKHGGEYVAEGGAYRTPRLADIDLVKRTFGGPSRGAGAGRA
ncbi:N-acetyltransferase [Microbacterium sp. zg.Y1090]|uniref:GNAT family N-acetyltransferase n=1 Tax=Microbacterium wangruii TaxID=3049073 RepID=UPI00214B5FED|nr:MULTISPECIES: GNAT family N-acetyltransferase [unclassified Microbacterium]MCR2817290.1 N-acetyltransferase [Microbacterium sp. zg.Y1090]MDL5486044.1 GNAT family N-acetyltransferase [Microbacterium sp. zg-Y1211]WIM29222.1 GNAT family N-acetyltransferase [Microbacterium sp. zg-Y1090]